MSTDDRSNVNDDASSNDEVQISDLNSLAAAAGDDQVRGGAMAELQIPKLVDKSTPKLHGD
jgi:type VI protein secretion system component Hcp